MSRIDSSGKHWKKAHQHSNTIEASSCLTISTYLSAEQVLAHIYIIIYLLNRVSAWIKVDWL